MRYLIGGFRFIFLVIFTFLAWVAYRFFLLFKKHNDPRGFVLRSIYLDITNFVMGNRVKVSGKPIEETALYVCNHRGLLDFFVVLHHVKAFVLSKEEMRNFPILGPASQYTGVIFVKRENKNSRGAARKSIVEALESGRNVLLFPEGTTNTSRTTMEFKIGSFEEISKNGFSVVPVALEYKSNRDLWFQGMSIITMFFSQYGKLITDSKVSFGPALKGNDAKQLMNDAREWIDNELLESQKDWSKVDYESVQ